MRRVARLARPLRNALTTGRAGSAAAAVVAAAAVTVAAVASSDMTTAMDPAVATRTVEETEAAGTEEVSGAVDTFIAIMRIHSFLTSVI